MPVYQTEPTPVCYPSLGTSSLLFCLDLVTLPQEIRPYRSSACFLLSLASSLFFTVLPSYRHAELRQPLLCGSRSCHTSTRPLEDCNEFLRCSFTSCNKQAANS
jgi:hypothetical protein